MRGEAYLILLFRKDYMYMISVLHKELEYRVVKLKNKTF